MKKKIVRTHFLLFFLLPFSALIADQAQELYLKASENWLWGGWEEAQMNFEQAAELSSGEFQQNCTLKALQIRYELGQYALLLEEAADLASRGLNQNIKRDALLIEAKALSRLNLNDQALQIIMLYNEYFNRDPVWLLASYSLYKSLNMTKEADRAGWIIRQYFPKSPEALILTGESQSSIKPSLLLSSQ